MGGTALLGFCSLAPLPAARGPGREQVGFGEQHVVQLSIVLVSLVREASKITELVTV